MEEWKEYKLGEILNFRRGHDLPHSKMQPGNIPVAGSNGIIGYHNEATPVSPCITIGRSGNVGTPYIYDECWAHNTVLYVDDFKGNVPLYIYYLLKTLPLSSFGGGSAVPTLNRNHIHPLIVRHTTNIKIQEKIVSILKPLDDKIKVNKRINDNFVNAIIEVMLIWLLISLRNDNLEQQAQSLFKSWFVDFEPFKNQPFVESELGLIPKGWRVVAFKDFIEASTEKASVDSYPEYSVTNNGIIPRETKFKKKLSKSTSKNKVLRKDNLVFGMSREILNWGIMEDEVGGVSSAYNIYAIDKDIVSPTYLRLYMRARKSDFNSLIGTAAREGQSLDKGHLLQKQIYVPTTAALQDFFRLFIPITEAQLNYRDESRRIAELRDTILPRLMSGEFKIDEVNM